MVRDEKPPLTQKIEEIERKLDLYEIIIALAFSICFVLIYGIIKVQHIFFYPRPMIINGLVFFGYSFLSIKFLFFFSNAVAKVGNNAQKVVQKLYEEWRTEKLLNKITLILGVPSFLIFIFKAIMMFSSLIQNYLI